jgi:hypothetical protein
MRVFPDTAKKVGVPRFNQFICVACDRLKFTGIYSGFLSFPVADKCSNWWQIQVKGMLVRAIVTLYEGT